VLSAFVFAGLFPIVSAAVALPIASVAGSPPRLVVVDRRTERVLRTVVTVDRVVVDLLLAFIEKVVSSI
jgi:hypothetical protein